MRDKVSVLRSAVLIGVVLMSAGLALAGLGVFHSEPEPTSKDKPIVVAKKSVATPSPHTYGVPKRLIIPKLDVDTSVLPMGMTADGDMEAPKSNSDTGWYSLGTRPGNTGSAVIAGHLGLRGDAVFGKLHLLEPGDKITLIDTHDIKVTFMVRKLKTHDRESDTTEIFNSKDGAHLNLITCSGDWQSDQATYEERLVVYSDKI